ncbi:MAG: hypothetical protein IT169_11880, partial [Bryobacterales bacterium]|nr:hypothetical protein [Bryobacterales bacterium]
MLPGPSAMSRPPISRRALLAVPGAALASQVSTSCGARGHWLRLLRGSEWRVLGLDREPLPSFTLAREWRQGECALRLRNGGAAPARVAEVRVFAFAHDLPEDTPIYTEGYQMLSQTGGTLSKPVPIGGYADAKHYRLPSPPG